MPASRDDRGRAGAAEYGEMEEARPFLGPLLEELKPYRKIIRGALGIAALIVLAAGLGLMSVYPVEKVASLDFRLDFDGAADGQYPSGAKFSAEDILAEPVVRRVYDENELKRYATFDAFRSSLLISSRNKQLELLELEYRARLGDVKLPVVERQRFEREFREKVASLKTSAFSLTMTRSERLREMDKTLTEKVLRRILSAWAEDAARIRGALKYDLPIYSPAMLQKEFLASEDYLIGIDMLRRKATRVISSIDQLLKVPGIQVFRLPGSGASLPEIRLRLEDLNTFRIAPTLGLIRATGISKDPGGSMRYIEDRLFESTRLETLAKDQEGKVREGLEVYEKTVKGTVPKAGTGGAGLTGGDRDLASGTVIPQFGESFIDRLMNLAGRNTDVAFRQDLTERMMKSGLEQVRIASEATYYRELREAFRSASKAGDNADRREATLKEIQGRFAVIVAELENALNQTQQLYDLISIRNLQPASALFSTERPMALKTTSTLAVGRFAGLGLLFVGFAVVMAAAGALFHSRFVRSRGARSTS